MVPHVADATATMQAQWAAQVRREGYAFVPAVAMRALLERTAALSDWDALAASWDRLAEDTYLARTGRYRRRRHAVFSVHADGTVVHQPHQPHYQSPVYNPLQGGIERWFEPIESALALGASLRCLLQFGARLFGSLAPSVRVWRVEAHQFRIEARADMPGQPTPEGVHRDGVDYVLVLLIARHNVASGTTTIHAADRRLLGSFTLTETFDAALVDDARVFHGVTPVHALDPARPAYRDVLVITFARKSGDEAPPPA